MDFQATLPQRRPRVAASFSARNKVEERYWKSFKSSVFIKSYAPIVAVHFSQSSPHRYAVTSGTRIQIYSSKTNRVVKTISKFKEIARSGHIRDDGKLVVAADDSGLVQVFDVNSRATLRSIRAHKQPVHSTSFSPVATSAGSPSFLTASDDTTLKVYDLATSTQISYLAGHTDYVRTASYIPSNPSLIVSGSYDGTVKLWDTRIQGSRKASGEEEDAGAMSIDEDEQGMAREVLSLNHGQPVERILAHPGGTQVISAGGPVIRVWDILSSETCLKAMSNHQKTVTCLEWGDGRTIKGNNKRRLLSAGLDGLIKSYDIEDDYRVGKTMRVGGGVLSLGMAPDESTLLIGSTTGELTVRKRTQTELERQSRGRSRADQTEGHNTEAALAAAAFNEAQQQHQKDVLEGLPGTQATIQENGEIRINPKKKNKKLKEWDAMLKSFRYADALDSAVSKGVHPMLSFAVLNELMHRDGLHQALSARDEVSLLPILRFLYDYATDPRFGSIACDVTNVLIDLYSSALGQSTVIDNLFNRLKLKVQQEVAFQQTLVGIKGQLQMLLAAQGLD